ncbi:MAG: hypothetical protein ACP5RD_06500 [bacterium]|jgi:hypothetical protein
MNTKKLNKIIIISLIIIAILKKIYSQTLTEDEKNKYAELAFHINYFYEQTSDAFYRLLYNYKNNQIKLLNISWFDLANYNNYLPSVNSKVYNDPKGLIITIWSSDNIKYFTSEKNGYQGLFAIEVNINNYIVYKYKKYIYYLVDERIDYKIDLSKGKVVTGQAGINPLVQKGEIKNLGDDSNYTSLYMLCY